MFCCIDIIGHWHCFHFFIIANSAVMKFLMHISLCSCLIISLRSVPGSEITWSKHTKIFNLFCQRVCLFTVPAAGSRSQGFMEGHARMERAQRRGSACQPCLRASCMTWSKDGIWILGVREILKIWGFTLGSSGKESACQCDSFRKLEFHPWVGKIPWRRKWLPTPAWRLPWTEEPGGLQSRGSLTQSFWAEIDWANGKGRRKERLEEGDTGIASSRDGKDEMVGWHHRLNGREFEQTLGDSEGQGSLACGSPQDHNESDTTEQLNNSWWKGKMEN